MSNVRRIVCHAQFTCARCRKPYTTMALASWDHARGVIGDGDRIGSEICNDCNAADREVERKAYNKSRQQLAWKRRAEKLAKGKVPHAR